MPKPHLRAIFFDVDDTLYSTTQFTNLARRASIQAMRQIGLKMPVETLLHELEEVINEFSSNYPHHYDKLLLRIPKRTYDGINPAMLIASAVCAYHETKHSSFKPFPDVIPFFKKLAKVDLIKGVITDGIDTKQAEKLLRLRIYPFLTSSAIFISDQIGVSKPNPKLFQYACNEHNLNPHETMYVGDNPIHDIDPANRIGMLTVLCNRGGKHAQKHGNTKPNYTISNFTQLGNILKREFSIPL
jgi:putative hydrolase of the HAD superfamily